MHEKLVCKEFSKLTQFKAQDEKSDLHSYKHPVPKCKCRECNTFAIVSANMIFHPVRDGKFVIRL